MKNVYSNSELPHLWMHKSQPSARTHTGNLYFEHETIYSYGNHFPIAKHYQRAGKVPVVLFTTADYSVTTSGHKARVRRAIPEDVKLFIVPSVVGGWNSEPNHGDNLRYLKERVAELVGKAARARSSWAIEGTLNEAGRTRKMALEYAAYFDEELPEIDAVPDADSNKLAAIKQKEKEAAAKRAQETKLKAAKRAFELKELRQAWREGGNEWLPWEAQEPVMLRVEGSKEKGWQVATSKGARVPVSGAVRVLKLVRACRTTGKEYARNGHTVHVGVYKVDKVTADGEVRAGCHVIPYSEVERIAPEVERIGKELTGEATS